MTTHDDAVILRSAATILERRSTKPNSLILRALLRVIRDTAARIDAEGGMPDAQRRPGGT